jgi:deferrochelatase/peroxidase EfeB
MWSLISSFTAYGRRYDKASPVMEQFEKPRDHIKHLAKSIAPWRLGCTQSYGSFLFSQKWYADIAVFAQSKLHAEHRICGESADRRVRRSSLPVWWAKNFGNTMRIRVFGVLAM